MGTSATAEYMPIPNLRTDSEDSRMRIYFDNQLCSYRLTSVILYISGGQVAQNSFHLFSVSECSKLYLSNLSVRQESAHSERHGIYVTEGMYLLLYCRFFPLV